MTNLKIDGSAYFYMASHFDRNAKQEINKVPSAHQTRARIAMFNAHLVLQPISFFFVAIVQHCFKVRKGLIFYQEVCDEMKLNWYKPQIMKLKYNTKLLVALKGFCSVRSETRARKGEKE